MDDQFVPQKSASFFLRLSFSAGFLLTLSLLSSAALCADSVSPGEKITKPDVLWLTGNVQRSSRFVERLRSLRWQGRLFILRYTSRDPVWRSDLAKLVEELPEWQKSILGHGIVLCDVDFGSDEPADVLFQREPGVSKQPLGAAEKKDQIKCQTIKKFRRDCNLEAEYRADDDVVSSIKYCVKSLNSEFNANFRPNYVLDDLSSESSRLRADKLRQEFEVKVGGLKRGQEDFFVKKAAMIRLLGEPVSGTEKEVEIGEYFRTGKKPLSVKIPPTLILRHSAPKLGLKNFIAETKDGYGKVPEWFLKPNLGQGSTNTSRVEDEEDYSLWKGCGSFLTKLI